MIIFPLFQCFGQDATESPTSTTKGTVQIEIATLYETFKNGYTTNAAQKLGSFLLLYGLADNFELRLGMDHQQEFVRILRERDKGSLHGFSPLAFGFGWDFLAEKGIAPQMSLVTDFSIPNTGGEEFKTNKLETVIKVVFKNNLSIKTSLLYNFGVAFGAEESYLYSLAYYTNFTNNFGVYAELNGDFPKATGGNHFWDIGLFYQITPNIQLEGIVGTGLATDQDIYLNGRVTITFPIYKQDSITHQQ